MGLSLSPRYDLFRFMLPDTFLCNVLKDKYNKILSKTPGVIDNAIALLNESIQGINFPGMSNLTLIQHQPAVNMIVEADKERIGKHRSLGKINVEGAHEFNYVNSVNPLTLIEHTLTITFRHIQGFITYFMLYEEILLRYTRPVSYRQQDHMHEFDPEFIIDILSETGTITTKIKLIDVYISSITGLDFSYSKLERDNSTFTVTFTFNNIDFEFIK